MLLKQFKVGDVIARTKPNNVGDHSFIGDKCVFLGFDCNGNFKIHEINEKHPFLNRVYTLSVYTYQDGWNYWKSSNKEGVTPEKVSELLIIRHLN